VILPRLKTDLVDAIEAILSGDLPQVTLEWSEAACVGVVVASQGYPGSYGTGVPIHGLDNGSKDVLVFHAGTSLQDGRLVTAGGRVLTVVGEGATLTEARARAYGGLEGISFQGAFYRQDIALEAVKVGG
jgi:phosphoribosylamine--glycine ligase